MGKHVLVPLTAAAALCINNRCRASQPPLWRLTAALKMHENNTLNTRVVKECANEKNRINGSKVRLSEHMEKSAERTNQPPPEKPSDQAVY